MSSEKFPLCEAAGLIVYRGQLSMLGGSGDHHDYIRADRVERLLSEAPVVYGQMFEKNDKSGVESGSIWNSSQLNDKTHTARLVCIQPLVRDTAEGLLREFIDNFGQVEGSPVSPWAERARKLLGDK